MERRGAIINNGIVENIVLWGDDSEAQFIAEGHDLAIETTNLDRQPAIGWTYTKKDGFRPAQPYPSWSYDGLWWNAPVAEPTDGGQYEWNETTKKWDLIPTE